MGQSLKATLQAAILFLLLAALAGWAAPDFPPAVAWPLRLGAPALVVFLSWLLYRNARHKDLLPDMLAQVVKKPFERDGLCFALGTKVTADRICWMKVFFQNRYEGACQSTIVVQAPRKSFSLRRVALAGIEVTLDCEGGAYGICEIPWPIEPTLQGKRAVMEVSAATTYPGGAGKLLRFREGLRVGKAGGEAMRTAASAGLLVAGVITVGRPATIRFQLPPNVAAEVPPGLEPVFQILWRPDLPIGRAGAVATSSSPSAA
jgi:hypothetical protein